MGASHAAEDKEDSICPYQERYALWKGSSRKAHSRRSLSLSQKKFSTKQNFSNQRAVKEDYVRSAVKIVEWSILKILISTMQGKLSNDDDSSQKEKCSVAFKWSWRRNHIYLRWQHQQWGSNGLLRNNSTIETGKNIPATESQNSVVDEPKWRSIVSRNVSKRTTDNPSAT